MGLAARVGGKNHEFAFGQFGFEVVRQFEEKSNREMHGRGEGRL